MNDTPNMNGTVEKDAPEKKVEDWESNLCRILANVQFLHGVPVSTPSKTVSDVKILIRSLCEDAIQEGYNRGRIRCLDQHGMNKIIEDTRRETLASVLPKEIEFDVDWGRPQDDYDDGFNSCLLETKKNMKDKYNIVL